MMTEFSFLVELSLLRSAITFTDTRLNREPDNQTQTETRAVSMSEFTLEAFFIY